MKWRRVITANVSEDDGLLRADRLLRLYGFKKIGQMAYVAYERSEPFSWSYALRPRSLFATAHIWAEALQTQTKFTVEIEVNTLMGYPPSLARKLMEGELNDLEKAVCDNALPVVNRQRQNKLAGTTQIFLLGSLFVIALAMGSLGWRLHPVIGLFVYLGCLFGFTYLANRTNLPLLPFPEFPQHNPPGAKLISERNVDQVPVAPKRR